MGRIRDEECGGSTLEGLVGKRRDACAKEEVLIDVNGGRDLERRGMWSTMWLLRVASCGFITLHGS